MAKGKKRFDLLFVIVAIADENTFTIVCIETARIMHKTWIVLVSHRQGHRQFPTGRNFTAENVGKRAATFLAG